MLIANILNHFADNPVDDTLLMGALMAAITAILVGFIKAFKAFWKFFKLAVSEAVDTSEHAIYTRHHLGPNGETPPLWSRVVSLEETHRDIMFELKNQSDIIQDQNTRIKDHSDEKWKELHKHDTVVELATEAARKAAAIAAEEAASKVAVRLEQQFRDLQTV